MVWQLQFVCEGFAYGVQKNVRKGGILCFTLKFYIKADCFLVFPLSTIKGILNLCGVGRVHGFTIITLEGSFGCNFFSNDHEISQINTNSKNYSVPYIVAQWKSAFLYW